MSSFKPKSSQLFQSDHSVEMIIPPIVNMGRSYVIPAAQNLHTIVIVQEKNTGQYNNDKEVDEDARDELEQWNKKCLHQKLNQLNLRQILKLY